MKVICLTKEVSKKFWAQVDKSGPNRNHIPGLGNCWIWKAAKSDTGYGELRINGSIHSAHRVSWMMAHGKIPEKLCVLHRCDVRNCVNPSHLFLGTRQDNSRDMVEKGRASVGVMIPFAKLTDEKVASIRSDYAKRSMNQSDLARFHQVSPSLICMVIKRKIWKHVP